MKKDNNAYCRCCFAAILLKHCKKNTNMQTILLTKIKSRLFVKGKDYLNILKGLYKLINKLIVALKTNLITLLIMCTTKY